jgi:hypothetical protein
MYNTIRDDQQYEDKMQGMSEKERRDYIKGETKALLGNSPELNQTRRLSLETLSESFLAENVSIVFR